MGVKGSGTIRNDAATHKDGRVNRIFPLTRSYRERRGSLFILVRTFPFRVAIHSTSYGFVPRPVCCAVRADKRRGVRCQGRQARARDALGDARGGPFENRSVVRDVRERVLFPALTEGVRGLNACVLEHAASACQTNASVSAVKSTTARFILRVMACRSICLLARAEELGAQNPRDAFRLQINIRLRRDFSQCFLPRASVDLVLRSASEPHNLTTARATVSHARSRPALSSSRLRRFCRTSPAHARAGASDGESAVPDLRSS